MTIRSEALACGATHYQGKVCPHGHSGQRYTCNKACVGCVYLARKAWTAKHVDQERQRSKQRARVRRFSEKFAPVLSSSDKAISAVKEDAHEEA